MGNPPKRAVTNAKWPTFEKYCVGKAGNPSMSMRKKVNLEVNLKVNLEVNLEVNLQVNLEVNLNLS